MSKSRLGHSVFMPLVLSLFWMAPEAAAAQSVTPPPPANSHARGYGTGWECDYGYRESAGLCAATALPANAYLVDFGYLIYEIS